MFSDRKVVICLLAGLLIRQPGTSDRELFAHQREKNKLETGGLGLSLDRVDEPGTSSIEPADLR